MTAPDEKRALAALHVVQKLSTREIDALMDAEVGKPMLGVMKAVAKAQFPNDDDATLARRVQLLVFGYLLHHEAAKTS